MFFNPFSSNFVIKCSIVAVCLVAGFSSYLYFKLPEDNPVEECAEYVIKQETGFDIDLSFTSKEK